MMMTPHQAKQLNLMRQMEQALARDSSVSTIVPMQSDYPGNPQMCLSANAFLDSTIAQHIYTQIIHPLRIIDPAQYYYPNSSLHVTFHSIRVIHDPPRYSARDIEASMALLEQSVPGQRPFQFLFQGVLSMPTSVSVIALATPRYDRFIKDLRAQFLSAGIPDDKTYFSDMVFANTTICRYTKKPTEKFLETVQKFRDIHIGPWTAKTVLLVETNAVCYPSKTTTWGQYRFRKN